MKGKTLKDVIGTEERSLYKLISLIADLSSLVREMIPRELGFAGGINPYGEKQLQIDVWSNDLFTKKLLRSGGFFAYPELTDAPEGKYRLQFESNPVGFITEKAGGQASTGTGKILDVEPTSIVQRVPTYLGDPDLVQEFQSTYKSKGQTV